MSGFFQALWFIVRIPYFLVMLIFFEREEDH